MLLFGFGFESRFVCQMSRERDHTGNAPDRSPPLLLVQVLLGLGIGFFFFFLSDKDLVIFYF